MQQSGLNLCVLKLDELQTGLSFKSNNLDLSQINLSQFSQTIRLKRNKCIAFVDDQIIRFKCNKFQIILVVLVNLKNIGLYNRFSPTFSGESYQKQ